MVHTGLQFDGSSADWFSAAVVQADFYDCGPNLRWRRLNCYVHRDVEKLLAPPCAAKQAKNE
jgi:hypothetical protein